MKSKYVNSVLLILIIISIFIIYLVSSRLGRVKDISDMDEKVIAVFSENTVWDTQTKLDIFNQNTIEEKDSKLIYPGLGGTYKFILKNTSNTLIDYKITFECETDVSINLKYRLRSENDYINNKNTPWYSIDELELDDIVKSNDEDVLVLEWLWEDSKEDEDIYFEGGYYTLKIIVNSEEAGKIETNDKDN